MVRNPGCETRVRVHFSVRNPGPLKPGSECTLSPGQTRVRVHFSVRRIFTGPPDLEWSGRSRELSFDGGTKAI